MSGYDQPPGPTGGLPPGVPPQEPGWRQPGARTQAREGRGVAFFVAVFLGILLLVSGALNVLLLFLSVGSLAAPGLTGGVDDTGAIYDVVRTGGDANARTKVLRIRLHGAISEGANAVLGAGGGSVTTVRRALDYARKDDSVAGILLDINSPGGGVTDSDEIYRMLRRFKSEHDVPMAALFGDLAASGGYYVAVAADRIIARRTSITGSIGVIMSAWNFAGLAEQLGIQQVAIKSEHTPYKDLLSPTKPVDEAERAILNGIVEELYGQFVEVVDEGRTELDREQVRQLANGAIYSARQALDRGLIDAIGDEQTAERWFTGELGSSVQFLEYRRRPSFRELLFGADAPHIEPASASLGRLLSASTGPRFLYFWQGAR